MNTQKIWLGAVTVVMSAATLGCGAAAAPMPAQAGDHVAGGGSSVAAVWNPDRPSTPRADRDRHAGGRLGHASLRSGRH